MKLLLVGGLGFIGRHLIEEVAKTSCLTVLVRPEDASDNIEFVKDHGLDVEIGDIVDGPQTNEIMLKRRPEFVVHLAALTGIKKCQDNPALAFSVNVHGTYNVVRGCIASESKMIFVSSREIYGEGVPRPTGEDDPQLPNNVYGVTKLLGERIVTWAASKHNLDYTILRLTNVYGPGGDEYGIQTIMREALKNGKIRILGGNQQMNLIYVKDVARAMHRCLLDPRSSRQIFNIGGHDTLSVDKIVSELVSLLGVPIEIERLPMREGESLGFHPSLEKAEKVLGYRPETTLTTGLQRTIDWYKEKIAF